MSIKKSLIGGAVLAAVSLPGIASAALVLDTGAPAAGATDFTFNSSNFFADEFSIAAGETVTQLAAYLVPGTGAGTAFTFDIYSAASVATNGNTVTRLNNGASLLFSTGATFTGSGWNTAGANWTPTQGGDYWLAIETSASTSLFAPSVGTQPNATAPALAFDVAGGTGKSFASAGTAEAAMQITASAPAVPLPASAWLLGGALAGFGALTRRRRGV